MVVNKLFMRREQPKRLSSGTCGASYSLGNTLKTSRVNIKKLGFGSIWRMGPYHL